MHNEPLEILKTKDEWIKLLLIFCFIFLLNLSNLFFQYKNFKSEEIYSIKGYIENIYKKEKYNVIKISSNDFTFFTSINKNQEIKKLDYIEANIITTKVNFISYLKGFYTKSLNIHIDKKIINKKTYLYEKINKQHENSVISQLYSALFLAIPTNSKLRETFANFGVSHLVAISGFHLGIISLLLYWVSYVFYKPLQNRYFPYRNAKADILKITSIGLFTYLFYIDFVPSFLRAFIMFLIGIYLFRNNIKIISFNTLLLTTLFIISFFPKLLFSISLWLSIAGVFYIFLFIKYSKNLNKVFAFLLFNFWIYFSLNPIIHFLFGNLSFEQLLSPILTLLFTIFYPLSLTLHFIGFGDIFDSILNTILHYKIHSIDIYTNIYFFIFYICISLLSIFSKKAFFLLNITWCAFNVYILTQL